MVSQAFHSLTWFKFKLGCVRDLIIILDAPNVDVHNCFKVNKSESHSVLTKTTQGEFGTGSVSSHCESI